MHDIQIKDAKRFDALMDKAFQARKQFPEGDNQTFKAIQRIASVLTVQTRDFNDNLIGIEKSYLNWIYMPPPSGDEDTPENRRRWTINRLSADVHHFVSAGVDIEKAVAAADVLADNINRLIDVLIMLLPAEWLADFPEWEKK